jgi:hypothetical protein
MTDAFVLGGVRTPFTRYGGSLSHISARGPSPVSGVDHFTRVLKEDLAGRR